MAVYAVKVSSPKTFPETLELRAVVMCRSGRDFTAAELAAIEAVFPPPKKRRTKKYRDANLLERLLPHDAATTLPIPGQLGVLLTSTGVHAALALSRDDGTPLDAETLASVRAMLAAWAVREQRVTEVIRAAAALLPAEEAPPSETLRAAVEAFGGTTTSSTGHRSEARRKLVPKRARR